MAGFGVRRVGRTGRRHTLDKVRSADQFGVGDLESFGATGLSDFSGAGGFDRFVPLVLG